MDAFPLEASRIGGDFRCTDQADIEIGRNTASTRVGGVVRCMAQTDIEVGRNVQSSSFGRDVRCTGQTDIEVRHQRMDQCAGATQSEEHQRGCYIDDGNRKSVGRDPTTTLTTSGLAGPVMSSMETKSVRSASNTEAPSSEGIVNSFVRLYSHGATVQDQSRQLEESGQLWFQHSTV